MYSIYTRFELRASRKQQEYVVYNKGDLMVMKMPPIKCITKLKKGKVTGIVSPQSVLVNNVLFDVWNLHPLPYIEGPMNKYESVSLDKVYVLLNVYAGNTSDDDCIKNDSNSTGGSDYSPEAPDTHQAAEDSPMLPVRRSTQPKRLPTDCWCHGHETRGENSRGKWSQLVCM